MFISDAGWSIEGPKDLEDELRLAQLKRRDAEKYSGPLTVKTSCIVDAIGFVKVSTLTAWSRELMDGWQHPSVSAPKVGIPIYDFEGQIRLHKERENLERVQLEKTIEFARLDAQAEYHESKRATFSALARASAKKNPVSPFQSEQAGTDPVKAIPRKAAHLENLKRALTSLGYDPQKIEVAKQGTKSPEKAEARSKIGNSMTKSNFDQAWKDLLKELKEVKK